MEKVAKKIETFTDSRKTFMKFPQPKPIITGVISISPAEAEFILKEMKNNRPVSNNAVEYYARQMAQGEFVLNGESVVFDHSGTLIDGQHRMQAVVVSKTTIHTAVVWGVPRARFHTVDQGKKRGYGDILRIHGAENSTRAAMAAKKLHSWATNTLPKGKRLTGLEMITILEQHPKLQDSADTVWQLAPFLRRADVAVMHYVLSCWGEQQKIESYLSLLSSGANLPEGSSILYVRDFLVQNKRAKLMNNRDVVIDCPHFRVLIEGWNNYAKGKRVLSSKFWLSIKKPVHPDESPFIMWSPKFAMFIDPLKLASSWLFGGTK